MTLKEYNAVYNNIMQQYFQEEAQIIEKAKLDGTWIEGSEDANRQLLEKCISRMHERIMQQQNKYRLSGFQFAVN